ncbi:hypothetical protein A2U01_0073815, partial [Trifolium medium]|nr:hypothetical protein [Trifolium medium]
GPKVYLKILESVPRSYGYSPKDEHVTSPAN